MPAFCASAAALRCCRAISHGVATMAAIPTMWQASSRTSHAAQGVGRVQSSSARVRRGPQPSGRTPSRRAASPRRRGIWGLDERPSGRRRGVVAIMAVLRLVLGEWLHVGCGRKADRVGPHVDGHGQERGDPRAAGVVGEMLVDQAAQQGDRRSGTRSSETSPTPSHGAVARARTRAATVRRPPALGSKPGITPLVHQLVAGVVGDGEVVEMPGDLVERGPRVRRRARPPASSRVEP